LRTLADKAAAPATGAVPARFNRRTHVRIKALFSLAVLGYAGLALAQAQNVVVEEKKSETVTVVVKETPKPPAFVFELHGFVSTTGYFQDANFNSGGGQIGLFVVGRNPVASPAYAGGDPWTTDKPIFGFDVRQTRLNFSVRGPTVMGGAVPKAVVEVDFFGSSEFSSAGNFSDVSLIPRLRIAYVELNWNEGRHIIQIGQQNMLTIGTIPQSLSHIAFPATYTAGTVGWRQPGIWGWHTFGDDLKFEFAWAVMKSSWTIAPGTTHEGINDGVASGLPAFEARGTLKFGKMFDVWLSGHWQTVDTNGPNVIAPTGMNTDLVTVLGTVGFKGNLGPVALAGSAWYGKNAGPLLGNVYQFTPTGPTALPRVDIFGYGLWAQAGMNVTKNLSGWITYGLDHPLYENIYQSGLPRQRNQNMVVMARYQDGGFAFGAEWLYSRTTDTRTPETLVGAVPASGRPRASMARGRFVF
jgi:hypothetical protein